MIVDRMIVDHWSGVLCEEVVVRNPRVEDFVRALEDLDGIERTMLCLYAANGQLTVGGGGVGYVVYVSLSETEYWSLLSDQEGDERVLINAGGQKGDFSVRHVVDKVRARRAGEAFMAHGEVDMSLRWEKA